MAATHHATCPPPPRPQPPPAPPCLPPVDSSLPSTPSPVAKTGRQSQQTTSTSPCYYDRRCTRIDCWHQHPNGRNIDDQKVRSRTPRRSKSRSTHRKSTTVHSGYTTPQRHKSGSESPAPIAPSLPAPGWIHIIFGYHVVTVVIAACPLPPCPSPPRSAFPAAHPESDFPTIRDGQRRGRQTTTPHNRGQKDYAGSESPGHLNGGR